MSSSEVHRSVPLSSCKQVVLVGSVVASETLVEISLSEISTSLSKLSSFSRLKFLSSDVLLRISNTDVLSRTFPRIFKINAKKVCILEYNMSEFEFV